MELGLVSKKAKSICTCGHTGDGDFSQHADLFQAGHGACLVPGCECEQFSWKSFTPEYEAKLESRRN
jgi:hypothetical protein